MKLTVFPTTDEVLRSLADYFVGVANQAIAARGHFTVALSGGNSPKKLYELLASAEFRGQVSWSKGYFFFGDERYVPADDPDSNYRMARLSLFEPLNIDSSRVFAVETRLDPAAAAQNYTAAIRRFFADAAASFDLVLLGLGDNAHTASLFPRTPVLHETIAGVKEVFLPDQQVYRITMTAPLLNQARAIAFLVYGADKAAAVQQVLEGPPDVESFPAQLIDSSGPGVRWFLDDAAASQLQQKS